MTSTLHVETGTAILTQIVLGGLQDPFPLYEELRELGDGFHWCAELRGWVATRYADIRKMDEDPELYSNEMGRMTGATARDDSDPVQRRFGEMTDSWILFLDPPRHTEIRRVFRHAFTPKAVAKYRATTERIADDLLAEYRSGDEVDFMEKLAAKIPIEVIATILGVPASDFEMFREWTDALVLATDPSVQGPARTEAISQSMQLSDYLTEIGLERLRNPQDDLISLIMTTDVSDGQPLDPAVAIAQAVLLLGAGNDTTRNLLGNAISILVDRPELQQRLVANPGLMPEFVEEVLRFDPSFHFDFKRVTRDHELLGREIKANTPVFHLTAAANRDPRFFDDPDPSIFDIDRQNKRHLAFSHGIHRCVGAPLARMEAQVGLTTLLERFPNITHGSTPPVRKVANIVARGWETRPVTLLS